jgi:hypothetical protein
MTALRTMESHTRAFRRPEAIKMTRYAASVAIVCAAAFALIPRPAEGAQYDAVCPNAKDPIVYASNLGTLPQDSCFPDCTAVTTIIGLQRSAMDFIQCATRLATVGGWKEGYALMRAGSAEFLAAGFEHSLGDATSPARSYAKNALDDLESAWQDYDEALGSLKPSDTLYADAKRREREIDHLRQSWIQQGE